MRIDDVYAQTLWLWVLRELVRHEGEVELTALMREVFKREKHNASTLVINALIRRGYATQRKDGNMIRVRVTELGRSEIIGVEQALLKYRNKPPEKKNSQWKKTKSLKTKHLARLRREKLRASSSSTASRTSSSPTSESSDS